MKRFILFLILALSIAPMQAQTAPGTQGHYIGTANGWAPWSGPDKTMHFATGFIGGYLGDKLFRSWDFKYPRLMTILAMLAIGYAKEEWDRHHGGSVEHADAFNTALGGALGATVEYKIRF